MKIKLTIAALLVNGLNLMAQVVSVATMPTPINTNALVMPVPTIGGGLGQIADAIKASDIGHATNYLIAPYATYAPKAPTKIGGGLFAVYNVNNYVGLGLGVDWLGQFTLVNANVSLKAEMHPFRGLLVATNTTSFAYNFAVTPFALAGAGVDFNGTGSHTIWDLGVQTKFGHWLGGRFGAGAAYGEWIGNSPYDVKRYHFFLNWQKGF